MKTCDMIPEIKPQKTEKDSLWNENTIPFEDDLQEDFDVEMYMEDRLGYGD